MIGNDGIETYMDRLGLAYEAVEDGLWLISDEDGQIVVHHDDPLLVLRVKLLGAPAAGREALFQRLLELNATEMITAAYGLEGDAIVAVASLQSENLDFNEFEGAIDSLSLAMTEHRAEIAALAGKE